MRVNRTPQVQIVQSIAYDVRLNPTIIADINKHFTEQYSHALARVFFYYGYAQSCIPSLSRARALFAVAVLLLMDPMSSSSPGISLTIYLYTEFNALLLQSKRRVSSAHRRSEWNPRTHTHTCALISVRIHLRHSRQARCTRELPQTFYACDRRTSPHIIR